MAAVSSEAFFDHQPDQLDPQELARLSRREATQRLFTLAEAATGAERTALEDRVVELNMQIAVDVARRYRSRGIAIEDLEQVAYLGLVKAARGFDPERPSDFLSYAVPTIRGEVRRYFRDHGWATRVPRRLKDLHLAIRDTRGELSQQLGRPPRPSEIADRLGLPTSMVIEGLQAGESYRSLSLDEMFGTGQDAATVSEFLGALDTELALIDDREALRPLLAELTSRDRTILALRFFRHLTQTQIADQVGLSQMHVSRVLTKTLSFLQQRMNNSD